MQVNHSIIQKIQSLTMGAIMGMAFAASVFLGGTYFMSKFLPNFRPSKGQIQKDVAEMRAKIAAQVGRLVPWKREEMELLSYRMEDLQSSGGITKSASGTIASIYHEPMLTWASKAYANAARNNLIFVRSSKYEFTFRSTDKGIDIAVGDHFLGTMNTKGVLYAPKQKEPLASIDYRPNEDYYPIHVYGKEVGNIVNPQRASQVNPRVIGLMAKLNEQAETIFTALLLTEVLRTEMEK